MKRILRHRSFRIILKEWADYLRTGGDPECYAIRYANILSEPRPMKGYPGLRELCGGLIFAIQGRSWKAVREALPSRLPPDQAAAFDLPLAGSFYKGFRKQVTSDARDYIKSISQARRAARRRINIHAGLAPFRRRFPALSQEKRG